MITNRYRNSIASEDGPPPRRGGINPAWEAAFASASAAKKNEERKREADKKRRAANFARISEIISAAFTASSGDDSRFVSLLSGYSGLPKSAIIKMAEENGLTLKLPSNATGGKTQTHSPAALAAQIIAAGNKARGRADEDDEPNDDDDGDRHEFPEEKKQRKNKKSKEPEDDEPDARSALAAQIITAGEDRRSGKTVKTVSRNTLAADIIAAGEKRRGK